MMARMLLLMLLFGLVSGHTSEHEGMDVTPDYLMLFEEMDHDKDGKVSWDEFFRDGDVAAMPKSLRDEYKQVWDRSDSSGDGLIDVTEAEILLDGLAPLLHQQKTEF
eukprot:TRINITY_DN82618_c0_g1_i1.p1 TRINITY_DN82618_c0_g1~~TRINITY_DN82618_c0_g1_i1.p1  ORF type:complete len:125 (-),score=37.61 TRINITY_DN82618_c0_g1_i1:51-371(-)